jgi:hypothetical protein
LLDVDEGKRGEEERRNEPCPLPVTEKIRIRGEKGLVTSESGMARRERRRGTG